MLILPEGFTADIAHTEDILYCEKKPDCIEESMRDPFPSIRTQNAIPIQLSIMPVLKRHILITHPPSSRNHPMSRDRRYESGPIGSLICRQLSLNPVSMLCCRVTCI